MKDYYSVLGVLPSAELDVIHAVYKALLKIYHPDVYQGDKEYAHQKTLEIREAFDILGNVKSRTDYDKNFKSKNFEENGAQFKDDTALNDILANWDVVTKYNPEIKALDENLRKIAHALSIQFKLYLLETKEFAAAEDIAHKLEEDYLELYFGSNIEIRRFAKQLILRGHKKAAKELNKAVTVFGKDIDPEKVINSIIDEFKLPNISTKRSTEDQKADTPTVSMAIMALIVFLCGILCGVLYEIM